MSSEDSVPHGGSRLVGIADFLAGNLVYSASGRDLEDLILRIVVQRVAIAVLVEIPGVTVARAGSSGLVAIAAQVGVLPRLESEKVFSS